MASCLSRVVIVGVGVEVEEEGGEEGAARGGGTRISSQSKSHGVVEAAVVVSSSSRIRIRAVGIVGVRINSSGVGGRSSHVHR